MARDWGRDFISQIERIFPRKLGGPAKSIPNLHKILLWYFLFKDSVA